MSSKFAFAIAASVQLLPTPNLSDAARQPVRHTVSGTKSGTPHKARNYSSPFTPFTVTGAAVGNIFGTIALDSGTSPVGVIACCGRHLGGVADQTLGDHG